MNESVKERALHPIRGTRIATYLNVDGKRSPIDANPQRSERCPSIAE